MLSPIRGRWSAARLQRHTTEGRPSRLTCTGTACYRGARLGSTVHSSRTCAVACPGSWTERHAAQWKGNLRTVPYLRRARPCPFHGKLLGVHPEKHILREPPRKASDLPPKKWTSRQGAEGTRMSRWPDDPVIVSVRSRRPARSVHGGFRRRFPCESRTLAADSQSRPPADESAPSTQVTSAGRRRLTSPQPLVRFRRATARAGASENSPLDASSVRSSDAPPIRMAAPRRTLERALQGRLFKR